MENRLKEGGKAFNPTAQHPYGYTRGIMLLLEAVNTCLSALGEARVTSTEVRHPTVDLIKNTVEMKKRSLLERGLWFNDSEVTMYPGTDGTLEYPEDALSVLGYGGEILIPRKGLLFDVDNNTGVFTEPKKLHVVYNVDFADLPECVANVVMYRSMREVYAGDLGVDAAVQNMQQNELAAMAQVEMLHLRNKRFSSRSRKGWVRLQNALRG
ncbi:putative putative tubular protein A [Pseudomonas phage Ep4]|uniref:Putative tubular protein A n=1 Tax=Pseudomonas phage Ep4 TaxID=3057492 RepID=A0AAU9EQM8_9CAUD|nr:putative putative tubular protein A [Pseudomonas phage Ep4]